MICDYCGANLAEESTVCPYCGHEISSGKAAPETEKEAADFAAETSAEDPALTEFPAEAVPSEEAPETLPEGEIPEGEKPEAPKEEHKGLLLGLVIGLSIVCALLIGLIVFRLVTQKKAENAQGSEAAQDEVHFAETSYQQADLSYFTDKVLDAPVASCGNTTLTNRQFAIYYWNTYYDILNQYGSQIYSLLDPFARLDSQFLDENLSFDQYLADNALENFGVYARFYEKLTEENYSLSESAKGILSDLEAQLKTEAINAGFASVDDYIHASFGPYCSMQDYMDYMTVYITVSAYINDSFSAKTFSDKELSDYYDTHSADFAGLQKLDKPNVNIRHILIKTPEIELSEGDEGYEAALEAAKAEAESKAREIYREWQAGAKTEESFAELAKTYSDDPGSVNEGGLYSDVYPGRMVQPFNDWCFADGRKVGDNGIVETSYGYHVMFFSGETENVYWKMVVNAYMQKNAYAETVAALEAEKPIQPQLENAAVYPVNVRIGG